MSKSMDNPLTREVVLLYHLGRASQRQTAMIDAARRRNDAVLAALEADLGFPSESEHEDSCPANEGVPASVARYLDERWNSRESINEVGTLLTPALEGRVKPTSKALLRNLPPERWRGAPVKGHLSAVHSCDDGSPPPASETASSQNYVLKDNTLFLNYDDEQVPFGIVRIFASRDGVPLASALRVMNYTGPSRKWTLRIPVATIFGGEAIPGNLEYSPYPACSETLSWFPRDAVQTLLERLPESCLEERRRVQELLDLLPHE